MNSPRADSVNSYSTNSRTYESSKDRYEEVEDEDEEQEEDEEEEITPAELIEKLQQCWLNEKFAPELIPHSTAVVECIIEQIKHMESNIKSAKKGDFRIAIHKLEIDRIKFMLYSYLRLRIKKIEKFASAILEEDTRRHPSTKSKLSPEEFAYATEYFKNVKEHLTASVLEHLPINLQDLNEAITMPRPDHDRFVFLQSQENLRGILVDDMSLDGRNEIVDMDKDDLYIMRYKPIGNYVNSGEIQLI